MRYFSRKKTALSIAISNLIIVALAILFWQYDIFNRSSTQSPSDETKALLMDDPKVVVTVNGEPIYQKEVDTVVKYSLQGTTQGRYLTGGVPPVRFSM